MEMNAYQKKKNDKHIWTAYSTCVIQTVIIELCSFVRKKLIEKKDEYTV